MIEAQINFLAGGEQSDREKEYWETPNTDQDTLTFLFCLPLLEWVRLGDALETQCVALRMR